MTIDPNIVYRIKDVSVHVGLRQIITPQQTISVRPKTFSLLLKLLENPLQVLSKDVLLAQIWDDVAVEEQVLVQSIRELRQLFSPLDVIQTYPRKGYAWMIPVEKLPADTEPSTDTIAAAMVARGRTRTYALNVTLVLVALIVIGIWGFSGHGTPAPEAKNVITVLPVDNRTEGVGLSWVRLGLMDQLIQSLESSPEVQVFDVPYVLQLLEAAGAGEVRRVELINRVFEISGSTLVVDLELSGSVNDYRLLYRLYTPKDQSSGVIVERHFDRLVMRVAEVVSRKTDARVDLSHLDNEFNSNLLAEAVQHWNQGESGSAIALLQSAISIEPENFLAYQLLLEYGMQLGDWSQAEANAHKVVALAEQRNHDRRYVFYYLLAKAKFAQGDFGQASHYLSIAQQVAGLTFDHLYQAYIASLWGDLGLASGEVASAENSYQRALAHHQVIACPIGVGLVRLKLIELYVRQGKRDQANEQMNLLKEVVEKHRLPLALPVMDGF